MNPRFAHHMDRAMRALPYILSLSAMIFAVACGKKDDKAGVKANPKKEGAAAAEEIFGKADLSIPANRALAERIEGGTAEISTEATNEQNRKVHQARVRILVRDDANEKKSVQLIAEGQAIEGLRAEIKKAVADKDTNRKAQLYAQSLLKLTAASSPEASGRYYVQVFCPTTCEKLAVRVFETKQKSDAGDLSLEAVKEVESGQVGMEFARSKSEAKEGFITLGIAGFVVGKGAGARSEKVDASKLQRRSFEEALVARKKIEGEAEEKGDKKAKGSEKGTVAPEVKGDKKTKTDTEKTADKTADKTEGEKPKTNTEKNSDGPMVEVNPKAETKAETKPETKTEQPKKEDTEVIEKEEKDARSAAEARQ